MRHTRTGTARIMCRVTIMRRSKVTTLATMWTVRQFCAIVFNDYCLGYGILKGYDPLGYFSILHIERSIVIASSPYKTPGKRCNRHEIILAKPLE